MNRIPTYLSDNAFARSYAAHSLPAQTAPYRGSIHTFRPIYLLAEAYSLLVFSGHEQ